MTCPHCGQPDCPGYEDCVIASLTRERDAARMLVRKLNNALRWLENYVTGPSGHGCVCSCPVIDGHGPECSVIDALVAADAAESGRGKP